MTTKRKQKPGYVLSTAQYYYVDDIKRLMDYSSDSAAYRFIRNINEELKEQGYIVKRGAIPKDYFDKKYVINNI